MANDSTAPGYLIPVDAVDPLSDDALADALQRMVVGITGLPGPMVRPRFQADPPDMPENDQDWCAISATDIDPLPGNVEQTQIGAADGGQGQALMRGFETMTVLSSFYGPNALRYARRLRDGLLLEQNRSEVQADGSLNLLWFEAIRNVSDFQNTTFRNRFDFPIRLRHRFERTYNVRNIVEIQGSVSADGGSLDGSTVFEAPFDVKG